jgi:hypothetical protein
VGFPRFFVGFNKPLFAEAAAWHLPLAREIAHLLL